MHPPASTSARDAGASVRDNMIPDIPRHGYGSTSRPNSSLNMRAVQVEPVEEDTANNTSFFAHVDNQFDGTFQ